MSIARLTSRRLCDTKQAQYRALAKAGWDSGGRVTSGNHCEAGVPTVHWTPAAGQGELGSCTRVPLARPAHLSIGRRGAPEPQSLVTPTVLLLPGADKTCKCFHIPWGRAQALCQALSTGDGHWHAVNAQDTTALGLRSLIQSSMVLAATAHTLQSLTCLEITYRTKHCVTVSCTATVPPCSWSNHEGHVCVLSGYSSL